MTYLLDTNAVIALMKGNERLIAGLRRHRPQDFAIPAIVAHKLFYGAYKSLRIEENLARIGGLQFAVLEFDRNDAQKAGEIRAALQASGTPIGPYDVLIAGQAVARGLILITRNLSKFERAAGLQAENWEG
ncbi:type II toxin-antitoxin system VapC family toxin [Rhizobium bangladeshense]|uniref:type II toxin-antitoxin system VapC family toxin n=1 Tax=Rhizobium bangladeshense TaxID=1138189 RepID=UPI0007E56D7A|nr:type II toxin-antitoxin system VapC family toxin [Rhizobium bangladeshense]